MRSVLLAAVLALGFGLATTGAQAATVNGNIATLKTAAATADSGVVEKAYYRRGRYYHRHWRRGWHRPYYRHYRPYRYWGPRYHHRGYYWRHHHRHWR
jgi:hypothetical protein